MTTITEPTSRSRGPLATFDTLPEASVRARSTARLGADYPVSHFPEIHSRFFAPGSGFTYTPFGNEILYGIAFITLDMFRHPYKILIVPELELLLNCRVICISGDTGRWELDNRNEAALAVSCRGRGHQTMVFRLSYQLIPAIYGILVLLPRQIYTRDRRSRAAARQEPYSVGNRGGHNSSRSGNGFIHYPGIIGAEFGSHTEGVWSISSVYTTLPPLPNRATPEWLNESMRLF
ncbi:hypothetical protein J6590_061561 [Homalodisca vitripennis]|nr:hypothetical protein J6590_061561 [Homalodisca vitripennis]